LMVEVFCAGVFVIMGLKKIKSFRTEKLPLTENN
jgi:hypothetical protein